VTNGAHDEFLLAATRSKSAETSQADPNAGAKAGLRDVGLPAIFRGFMGVSYTFGVETFGN
jgi:hypothetical protein